MGGIADSAGVLAADSRGLDLLRLQAKAEPGSAVKGAAQQFESLFLEMLLKNMREATPQDGLFDSDQTRTYTAMLDQQIAQSLSKRGIGLADMMARQLSPAAAAIDGAKPAQAGAPAPSPAKPGAAQDFVDRMMPHAAEASRATGIPAQFMIGQAALESGWGRREIRAADGSPSHNLFGIKAGGRWNGPVAEATTTEYVNGVAQKSVERFRAYGSYQEAFNDYASLLKGNPRYSAVLSQGQDAAGFARGLQRAGYATDPTYADKLTRVLGSAPLRSGNVV